MSAAGDGRATDCKRDHHGTTRSDLSVDGGGSMNIHLLNTLNGPSLLSVNCTSVKPILRNTQITRDFGETNLQLQMNANNKLYSSLVILKTADS